MKTLATARGGLLASGASQRAAAEGDEARARTIREQVAALEIERRRLRDG